VLNECFLRGERYNAQKTAGHGAGSAGQSDPQRTSATIAAEEHVSEKTVRRDAKMAEELDEDEREAPPFH
jgi:hypothetical protein